MGSAHGQTDERPVHDVFLDSFYIDLFEVTTTQYVAFLNATDYHAFWGVWTHYRQIDGKNTDPTARYIDMVYTLESVEMARHPVVDVTWNGADAYCAWAGLRLPTEAEWEKAARGTNGTVYPWGDDLDHTRANYGSFNDGLSDVGAHPDGASPYGVHDMAGNAWEWVGDWYGRSYYATSPESNPRGPSASDSKILRGGGWGDSARFLRSSFRFPLGRGISYGFGFRCARDAS